jgi:hypothetical protein
VLPDGVDQLAAGLVRWTAPSPDWTPDADWDQQVGSVLYDLGDSAVLFDPLLPREGRDAFLAWLDELVAGRPVSILTTISDHRRDRDELAARYEGNSPRAWNFLPPGVTPKPLRGAGETPYWLPGAAALVFGDRLIGAGAEPGDTRFARIPEPASTVQLCPESWLDDAAVDRAGLARLMRPLVELAVERLLVSHGEPVLHDGRAELARAIREAGG